MCALAESCSCCECHRLPWSSILGTFSSCFLISQNSTHPLLPIAASHFSGTSHWQLKNLFSLTIPPHPHSLQNITLQISFSLSSNSFIYKATFKYTKIKIFRTPFPFWFYKMELHWLKCKSCTTQGHFIPQTGDLSFYYKMFHFPTHWKWSSSLQSSKDSKLFNLITYYLNLNRVHHFCENEMT